MATPSNATLDYRPPYLAAAIAGLAVLALYVVTLAPTTAMWDTSEYITAAYTLGLPHPPGNPLFVLMGRVVTLLPIARGIAARINLFAALCSATAAAMWFLITERVLVGWFPQHAQRLLGASIAALLGATAFTVWNQSVANEHTYTVSLAGIAIVSWLTIYWCDHPDGRRADKLLVLVAYLLGLSYSNHMAGLLAAPAVAVAVLARRPRTIVRWRLLLTCLVALGFGVTPFAMQPIRAAYNPAVNEGDPTACRSGPQLSCTFSKGTYDAFMYNFNRKQYAKPALSERQADFSAQIGMWWTYFRWQWMRDANLNAALLQSFLAAVFFVLGLFGAWAHYTRHRPSFWYFGTLMFTMTLALIYYLNFKYGASQSPELVMDQALREVRDRDYFFLWSYSAWGVWAALGLLSVWGSVASLIATTSARVDGESVRQPTAGAWRMAAPTLLLALVPLCANWSWASRAGTSDARDFAADLLNSVEPYGVLVVVGDNDTFPLWYAQEVEGIRDDVTVANTSLLGTDWYARQLIQRPIRPYDAAKGPALYRNRSWPKPTTPALNMTVEQAAIVPDYFAITQPTTYQLGQITATINPRNLPLKDGDGRGYLTRADIFVLRMIADSYGNRPIYLSRTSGGYATELGLQNNVLTQGLAAKIFIPSKTPSADTVLVQGDGWFDLKRTKTLWDSVFVSPKALAKRRPWVDEPSASIPDMYVATGAELAGILNLNNDPVGAERVMADARHIATSLGLERYIPHLDAELTLQRPGLAPTGDSALGGLLKGPPTAPSAGAPAQRPGIKRPAADTK